MNFLLKIIFYFCLSSTASFIAGNKIMPEFRELIILSEHGDNEDIAFTLSQSSMDTSEVVPGIGAISGMLLTALYQEAAPILCSTALWENIVQHKTIFDNFIKHPIDSLFARYYHYPRFSSKSAIIELKQHCLYVEKLYQRLTTHLQNLKKPEEFQSIVWEDPLFEIKQAPLKLRNYVEDPHCLQEAILYLMCSRCIENRYVVREIYNRGQKTAYLFLPKTYLKHIEIDYSTTTSDSKFTTQELTLGLAFEHTKLLSNPFAITNQSQTSSIISAISSVIIPHSSAHKTLHWHIYLMGHGLFKDTNQTSHGSSASRIAGLSIPDFQNLLLFLKNKISTRLLFYSSCSAGGANLMTPYQENKTGRVLTFPFTIITEALTEATIAYELPHMRLQFFKDTEQELHYVLDSKYLIHPLFPKLTVDSMYDFTRFFNTLRIPKLTPTECQEALKSLSPWLKKPITWRNEITGNLERNYNGSMLSIRLPHAKRFSVLRDATNIIELTEDSKSCIIPSNCSTVLITGSNFKQPVLVEQAKGHPFPSFIAMQPGKGKHIFTELQAPDFRFSDIIEGFFPFDELSSCKISVIKNLHCMHNNKKTCLFNVMLISNGVLNNQNMNCVSFTHQGNTYYKSWPSGHKPPKHKDFTLLNNSVHQELATYEAYAISANQDKLLLSFNEIAHSFTVL